MAISRYGWHFLANDRKLRHGNRTLVRVGQKLEWRTKEDKKFFKLNEVYICSSGMHASAHIADAESFADNYIYDNDGGYLCRVKVDGTNYEKRNHPRTENRLVGKFVGTHRTVLGMVPVSWLADNFGDASCWDKYKDLIIAEMARRNKRNKNKTMVR